MILRAAWILPISSPPLKNHEVVIEEGVIQSIRPATGTVDDVIVLPGLVNAHAHLEYAGQPSPSPRPPPQKGEGDFTAWARHMKEPSNPGETIRRNIQRLVETGTTTVADHITPNHDLDYLQDSPLRHVNFLEILGSAEERSRASLEQARKLRHSLSEEYRQHTHLTPHSLYAVHPKILEDVLVVSGRYSVHFLESADERQWWENGTGPLADLIRERAGSPGQSLRGTVVMTHSLFIHANYVEDDEITWLKKTGATVVHGPGSHRYFGHRPFPLETLRATGIPVALGTDSLASNEDLDMFREMRLLRESFPHLSPESLLRMATLTGAQALGLERICGSLAPGLRADLLALPLPKATPSDPYEACFQGAGSLQVFIEGRRIQ